MIRRPQRWARGLLAAGALTAGAAVLGGCSLPASVTRTQVVTHFAATTTPEQRVAVLTHCSGYPQTSPMPVPTGAAARQLADASFDVTHANTAEQTALISCIAKMAGVTGVELQGPDSGS
ncbi:MAG TPA: hypothetical protein VGD03_01865 [Frankiaceae bacterium]